MNYQLLIIDEQKDFCDPDGMLFVPGAKEDCKRLSSFIEKNVQHFSAVHMTMDSHPFFHIAHPVFWKDENGKQPELYTVITHKDFMAKKYMPVKETLNKRIEEYLLALETHGRYKLTIWPPHCLIGTQGHSLEENVYNAVHKWEMVKPGNTIDFIQKAANPLTEHYSAIQAEVPDPSDPQTRTNFTLIDELKHADKIFVAGEALSHCVANTLNDLFVYIQPSKITLLKDCCSSVSGYEKKGEELLCYFMEQGMNIETSNSSLE